MQPFLPPYIESEAFALPNHKSGESPDLDTQHAKDRYDKQKGHRFAFMEQYKVLRVKKSVC